MPQYFGQLPKTDQPWSTLGAVQAIQRDDCPVKFKCSDACVVVSVLASNLIRIRMAPNGEFMPRRSWAVTLDDPEWAVAAFEVEEIAEVVEIITEQIRVQIQRDRII